MNMPAQSVENMMTRLLMETHWVYTIPGRSAYRFSARYINLKPETNWVTIPKTTEI